MRINKLNKKSLLSITAAASMMISSGAVAGDIEEMQKQINALQTQLQSLQTQLAKQQQQGSKIVNPSDIKITMKPSPKIESADGEFSFQPFGRLHADTVFFNDDTTDNPDSNSFRRARLGFKGNVGDDWAYKFELDFAKEASNFRDVYIAYTGTFDQI